MATPRKTTPTKTTDEPAAPDNLGFLQTLGRSEGVVRKSRGRQPIDDPVLDALRKAARTSLSENTPLHFTFDNEEAARKISGKLHRAAQIEGLALRKSVTQGANGQWVLDFQTSTEKRERAYSADDIRKWAVENGLKVNGKIPPEVREAFKVAKGYGKQK